jgi:hypothetical protein
VARIESLSTGVQTLAGAAPIFVHRPHVSRAGCINRDHRRREARILIGTGENERRERTISRCSTATGCGASRFGWIANESAATIVGCSAALEAAYVEWRRPRGMIARCRSRPRRAIITYVPIMTLWLPNAVFG